MPLPLSEGGCIGHFAHDVDPFELQVEKLVGHAAPGKMEGERRHLAVYQRPHTVEEPAHPFLIGQPVHGAEVEEGAGLLGYAVDADRGDGKGDGDDGFAAPLGTEVVGIVVGDAHHAVEVVDMLALICPEGECQVFDVPPLAAVALAHGHTPPYLVLDIVGAENDGGSRVPAYHRHIGGEEDALDMDDVESLLLQHLGKTGGEGLALETAHVVGVAAEHGHTGIEGMEAKVDEDRLEAGVAAVVVGDAVFEHGVLLAAHGQHPHLAAGSQQPLGDAVHGQGAAVDRRIGGLATELEDLHY